MTSMKHLKWQRVRNDIITALRTSLITCATVMTIVSASHVVAQPQTPAVHPEQVLWDAIFEGTVLERTIILAIISGFVAGLARLIWIISTRRMAHVYEGRRKRYAELNSHPFFARIAKAAKMDMMDINIGKNTPVLRDMLRIKFHHWEKGMRDWVNDPSLIGSTPLELELGHSKTLSDLINAYERDWIALGIPRSAIDIFNKWHNAQASRCIDAATDAIHSHSNTTSKARLEGVLAAHSYLVLETLADCAKALRNMNGELTEYIAMRKAREKEMKP